MKLFFEGITKDRTWIPGAPEKRVQHDLRKIRKIYFTSHLLLHIRNSVYTGPLQKQLSDNLYVKHTDINYIYCLTKISIQAKRSISRVFSLFIVPSLFFVHCPYKGRINQAESVSTGLKPY